MKIAIIGYGKMGKEIEKIALAKGYEIVLKITVDNLEDFNHENISKADVAIEFSTPHSVLDNVRKCADAGVPVVVGTTAWYEHFDEVSNYIKEKNAALFYATNFSIGVNLFFKINEMIAGIMKDFNYALSIDEIHHTQKLDAPSGTAITTAEHIIKNHPQKKNWVNKIVTESHAEINLNDVSSDILIRSIRKDAVPGTHTVYYDSEVDTIEITHTAHNRIGFAAGAVNAAEWINGKKGIYNMNDLLSFVK
jgi:4-hydroxy-tetrahydrodipicolinate reductase